MVFRLVDNKMVRLSPSEEGALQGMPPEFDPTALSEIADILDEAGFVARAKHARAALDEIERQNASLDDAEKLVRKNAETMNAQAKRIAELEGLPREGLFGKYRISKSDGSVVDPNADYFVLRLDTDPIARIAATEYSLHTSDEKLGKDLQRRVSEHLIKSFESVDRGHVSRREDSWPLAALRQDEIVFGHLNDLIAIGNERIAALKSDIEQLTALVAAKDVDIIFVEERGS